MKMLSILFAVLLFSASVAIAGDITRSRLQLDIGIARYLKRDVGAAAEMLGIYYTANPQCAEAAYYLGRIAYDRKEHQRSEELFQRACELDPQNSSYAMWLGRAYVQSALESNFIRKALYAGKIRNCLLQAIELDSTNSLARQDLIKFYVLVPGIAGGSTEKALRQAAILRRQNQWEGFKAFGTIYALKKDFAQAELEFRRAVEAYPHEIQFYDFLAEVYRHLMQYDKLLAVYEQASAQIPELATEIALRRAKAFSNIGNATAAFEVLDSLLKISPDQPLVWYEYGAVAARFQLHLEQAEALLQQFLRSTTVHTSPTLADAHLLLAEIAAATGRPEAARSHQKAAASLAKSATPRNFSQLSSIPDFK